MAGFLKQTKDILKQAFKINWASAGLNSILDIVIIGYIFLAFQVWILYVSSQTLYLSKMPLDILGATTEQMKTIYIALFKFLFILVGGILIAFILYVIVFSLCKYFTWSKIFNSKRTFKRLRKFFWMNLLWYSVLAAPFIFIIVRYKAQLSLDKSIVAIIILVFFMIFNYFSGILNYYFMKAEEKQVTSAIKGAFFSSFKKAHYLLLWQGILFLFLAILLALAYVINLGIRPILIIIALLIYFAVSRLVMSKVLEKYLA